MRYLSLVTLRLIPFLIILLTGCDKTAEDSSAPAINPKALADLDNAVGKYRSIITSLKNSGLSDEEYRKMSNDADFALRDFASYVKAKEIDLSSIGIPDIEKLADEIKEMFGLYDARFLKPHKNKTFRNLSFVTVHKTNEIHRLDCPVNFSNRDIPYSLFSRMVKKYPTLADEIYHWDYVGERETYTRLTKEVILFVANYDSKNNSAEDLVNELNKMPNSGRNNPINSYWQVLIDGQKLRSLIITEITPVISDLNTRIKKAMN